MNRINYIYLFFLIHVFLFSFSSPEKDIISKYEAADNSGSEIKIIKGDYGISAIYFFSKNDEKWTPTKILSMDIIQEYIKVQSSISKKNFELYIDWNDHKIIRVDELNNRITYWLITT